MADPKWSVTLEPPTDAIGIQEFKRGEAAGSD